MPKEEKELEYFTKTNLKERKWKDTMNSKLLEEPDVEKSNRMYPGSYILLFEKKRVLEVEKKKEFKEHLEKRKKTLRVCKKRS